MNLVGVGGVGSQNQNRQYLKYVYDVGLDQTIVDVKGCYP